MLWVNNMEYDDKDYVYELVAYNIKKYRKLANMTQAKLAEQANVSHEFIRRIESTRGEKKFTLYTLYKISLALNIELYKFFIDTRNN